MQNFVCSCLCDPGTSFGRPFRASDDGHWHSSDCRSFLTTHGPNTGGNGNGPLRRRVVSRHEPARTGAIAKSTSVGQSRSRHRIGPDRDNIQLLVVEAMMAVDLVAGATTASVTRIFLDILISTLSLKHTLALSLLVVSLYGHVCIQKCEDEPSPHSASSGTIGGKAQKSGSSPSGTLKRRRSCIPFGAPTRRMYATRLGRPCRKSSW